VSCSLFSVLCSLFSVLCSLFSVLCSLFSVLCSLFSVLCPLFSVLCSLFSVLFQGDAEHGHEEYSMLGFIAGDSANSRSMDGGEPLLSVAVVSTCDEVPGTYGYLRVLTGTYGYLRVLGAIAWYLGTLLMIIA
jgi:hypothetical protein